MKTNRVTLTLETDVIEYLNSIGHRKRSRQVNAIIKEYLSKREKSAMIEGFQQKTEGFENWEKLGFESDAWK